MTPKLQPLVWKGREAFVGKLLVGSINLIRHPHHPEDDPTIWIERINCFGQHEVGVDTLNNLDRARRMIEHNWTVLLTLMSIPTLEDKVNKRPRGEEGK